VHNLNKLLEDPNIIPVWDSRNVEPEASTSTPGASTSQAPSAPSRSAQGSGTTPEQLARLRALVTSMGANSGPNPGMLPLTLASAQPNHALKLSTKNRRRSLPHRHPNPLQPAPPLYLPPDPSPIALPPPPPRAAAPKQRPINTPTNRPAHRKPPTHDKLASLPCGGRSA